MLTKITFTGIDQKTKIKDLELLQTKYPFVEFGFLISETHTNKNDINRYPSLVMLKGMKNIKQLSLHICGKLVRNIIKDDDWTPVQNLMDKYFNMFSRIQLNTAGYTKFAETVSFPENKETIIQFSSNKPQTYEHFKNIPNIVGFQDNSGGNGIFTNKWVIPTTDWFGFAGGINKDNVIDVIQMINNQYTGSYWIDMESSVRTNDKFDTQKCEEICEIVLKNKLIKI